MKYTVYLYQELIIFELLQILLTLVCMYTYAYNVLVYVITNQLYAYMDTSHISQITDSAAL